jgi:hypothetical protein
MSSRERQALDSLGIMLDKAGYGVQMLAQNFDTYTIGMGMTVAQTQSFTREVHAMAQQIGITSSQIGRDFPAALKVAIQYTGQETRVLRGLMEQAKATGLEMGKLTSIVAQYDTFEGAGEAVGRLNAILGGPYLNAIQMVYATEDQRLQLLRQSVSASGRQFAALEKYEQKAIMAAAGINDINTALQLFGGGGAAFEQQIRKQEELEEMARRATPVFQQITSSLQRLAIGAKPFVDILDLLSKLLAKMMPNSMGMAIAVMATLSASVVGITIALKRKAQAILRTKMENLNMNRSLRTTEGLLIRLTRLWHDVSNAAVTGMQKMTSASNTMSAAAGGAGPGRRGVPTGTRGPIPPGGGGVPPAGGGGASRAAGYAAIAGGIATYLAPQIQAQMSQDTVAQRKTAAGVAGMLKWGGTMAMMIPTIGAILGAPLSGGASLGLLALAAGAGAAGGAITTHHGGLNSGPVPGPRGRETMIRAQGGEMVVQPEQLAALARGSQDPRLGQNVGALNQTVSALGTQLSNFEHTVNQLMGAHLGKKSDMFVTVNMDSRQVTEQVITNLETNPNYGLALG